MKAVNLIPSDSRRGASAVSRSGGGAYLVLAVLAGLVLMTGVYVTEGGRLDDKKAEAAQSRAEAQQKSAEAAKLVSYTSFANLKTKRVETVKQIAESRFDWSHVLHDLARVIPENTWLTSLTGSVAPGVAVSGGSGGGSALRSSIDAPAIEISGCTTSQPAVAKMMARMRLIDGVQRVTLTRSEKSGSSGGGGEGCATSESYPTFQLIVFFEPMAAATPAAAVAGATSAAGTTTTPTTTTSGASQ